MIITAWNDYRKPDFARMKSLLNEPLIFDGRNLYIPERKRYLGFKYFSLGRN